MKLLGFIAVCLFLFGYADAACSNSTDCDLSEYCSDLHECVADDCEDNGDCNPDEICREDGACVCSCDMMRCRRHNESCYNGKCKCDECFKFNGITGDCEPNCFENNECCPEGEICGRDGETCTTTLICEVDGDCYNNEICEDGVCVCFNDKVRCRKGDEECNDDGECVCDECYIRDILGSCRDYCVDNNCCSSPFVFCNKGTNYCQTKNCNNDGECTRPNEKCIKGCVCYHDEYVCTGEGQFCDYTGQCACEEGYIQEAGSKKCIRDCTHCGPNEICARDKTCRCKDGYCWDSETLECVECPVCPDDRVKDDSGACVLCTPECRSDGHCSAEGAVCNAFNQCECPEGYNLFKGKCTPPGHIGGTCVNDKCYGRFVLCNTSANLCFCHGRCEPVTVCKRKVPRKPKLI